MKPTDSARQDILTGPPTKPVPSVWQDILTGPPRQAFAFCIRQHSDGPGGARSNLKAGGWRARFQVPAPALRVQQPAERATG